jgi:membrane-bound metal-dependent hydrolase YbcI (DUF457 family)
MFIGHFAVGFAAKRWVPAVSLGTLFLACQLADLLWPTLVLLGVEKVEILPGATAVTPLDFVSYPYSHSLLGLALWGGLLGLTMWFARRGKGAMFAVVALVVLSHWVLDVVSHRPDMPLTFDGPTRLGLGLWNSRAATVLVESLLFAIGVTLYVRATRPKDGVGRWALVALIAFLATISIANLVGPPPPSAAAVAWVAESMWLLVAWGYWIDRHRVPV